MIFFMDFRNLYYFLLILGWVVSFLNVMIGSLIITRAFRDPGKGFINKVLLSMVVRMFASCAIVFVLIYYFKIDKISLAVYFFSFTFYF